MKQIETLIEVEKKKKTKHVDIDTEQEIHE